MASAKRFEDLMVWQTSRQLVNLVYRLTDQTAFRDFSLKDQLRRAAVSVLSNIAEGFERGTREEFLYFLYVAKGSSGEVRCQLQIACDQKYITTANFNEVLLQAKRVSAQLYHLIESLKGSKFKGLRYKESQKKDPEKEAFERTLRENVPPQFRLPA